MDEYNVIFDSYENGLKLSDIMELHTLNNPLADDLEQCHKSCPGCEVKCILDHILNTNSDDDLTKDGFIDTGTDCLLKKSDSMCNLLHLNDSQSGNAESNSIQSNICKEPNVTHVSSKNVFTSENKSTEITCYSEKNDTNKIAEHDKIPNLNPNSQLNTFRRSNHIRSSTESLLSNTPNRLRSRRSVSKTTLVSKFLESIDNKVDVKSTAKQKTAKKPCSLYIKNVKIDRHLQELTKTMISREISTSLGKSTSDLPINAKLKNFLYSQTLIYPNEKIYRVCKALDVSGRPLLLVLTDYSVYLIGTGACCCTFRLLHTMWYEKLAAVVIGPFFQLLTFINKMNKKLYAINTAAVYGSAREFTMFAEIAVRGWSYVNSKNLFFSAVQIDNYHQMKCFHDLISDSILPKDEEILFLTWVWLQEEYLDISPLGPQKEAYVMFKGGTCLNWIPSYIRLKGGVLYVFDSAIDRVPKQAIELVSSPHCLTCRCSVQSDRPYCFELIKAHNNNNTTTTFLFGTANETEMKEWIAILISVTKGLTSCYDDEKEVSLSGCYLLMTSARLISYAYPNTVLNHCHLDDIVSFKRTNQSRDLYCLLEFGCREALEGGGDWILHFVSKETNDQFCAQFEQIKPNLFLEVESVIGNESLINRCRRVNFKLQSMWDPFFTSNDNHHKSESRNS